jgi:hypothetical protein
LAHIHLTHLVPISIQPRLQLLPLSSQQSLLLVKPTLCHRELHLVFIRAQRGFDPSTQGEYIEDEERDREGEQDGEWN